MQELSHTVLWIHHGIKVVFCEFPVINKKFNELGNAEDEGKDCWWILNSLRNGTKKQWELWSQNEIHTVILTAELTSLCRHMPITKIKCCEEEL